MLGIPKYNYKDKVRFLYPEFDENGNITGKEIEIVGEIYIIDKYGTFSDPSDVSYDILTNIPHYATTLDENGNRVAKKYEGEVLIKHLNEKFILGLAEEN